MGHSISPRDQRLRRHAADPLRTELSRAQRDVRRVQANLNEAQRNKLEKFNAAVDFFKNVRPEIRPHLADIEKRVMDDPTNEAIAVAATVAIIARTAKSRGITDFSDVDAIVANADLELPGGEEAELRSILSLAQLTESIGLDPTNLDHNMMMAMRVHKEHTQRETFTYHTDEPTDLNDPEAVKARIAEATEAQRQHNAGLAACFELFKRVRDEIVATPYLFRVQKRLERMNKSLFTDPWVIASPADVLFEQRLRVLEILGADLVGTPDPKSKIVPPQDKLALALSTLHAQPVFWNEEILTTLREAVRHQKSAPPPLERDTPLQPMFWTWPRDFSVRTPSGNEITTTHMLVMRTLTTPDDSYLHPTAWVFQQVQAEGVQNKVIWYSVALDDATTPNIDRDMVITMLAFMNTDIVDQPMVPLPNEEREEDRKAAARQGRPVKPAHEYERVRFISLRRRHRDSGEAEPRDDGQEPKKVEWKHRWVVGGHVRLVAHGPRHSLRKPIYIMPFVKGPEDKPMLTKAYRVVR
jgi:hypothetical protein